LNRPSLSFKTILIRCAAALGLLGALSCTDHKPGGTTLYVFDDTSKTVMVWADINAVYNAVTGSTAVAGPDRTIGSNLLGSVHLAWGGLAVDSSANVLYLVSESGTVYAIYSANTQNSTTLSQTNQIISYNLGLSTDRFPQGSWFGQAAVDSSTGVLYVTENAQGGQSNTGTRIWKIAGPSSYVLNGVTLTPPSQYTIGVASDTNGAGLAAGLGGDVFALCGGGNNISDLLENTYSGPRLRYGTQGSFPQPVGSLNSQVIIGPNTGFYRGLTTGSLGYDPQNSAVYVFTPVNSPNAVLVFNKSQFATGTYNVAPARTLAVGDANLGSLQVISHPSNSDWMVGATIASGTASSTSSGDGAGSVIIWKSPSGGPVPSVSATMPGTGLEIRGLAIGGNG